MRAYRTRLALFTVFLAVYTLVANEPYFARRTELFPFFNWSLFSHSTTVRTNTTLAFTSLNGVAFDKPVLANAMIEELPWVRRNIDFKKTVWSFGDALMNNKDADAARLRAFLEEQYFGAVRSAEYQLVLVEYNALDRYHDRTKVKILKNYGTYRYAAQQ
ncbi:hypothetical protein [Hyphococcus sp.]|uniref:hypothetical protein n=1 Tax=Hyphococcus sp. TaxID=2038636 RepID=UPI0020889FF2|nr:MAG: hypothetical protein DHS20C04_03360 [Marinicaulis sp.]